MNPCKNILVLILSLCILIFCATLPVITTEILDRDGRNQPVYRTISSVQLNFSPETRIPLLGKLALLKACATVEITEDEATLSAAEALEAVNQALAAYYALGVFPEEEITVSSIFPILAYNPENPLEHAVLWAVEQTCTDFPYSQIGIVLDDETGKILVLNFESQTFFDNTYFDNVTPEECCIQIATQYFSELEITLPTPEYQESPDWETSGYLTYRFGDMLYGEVSIIFNLFPQGFYIYFD